MKAYEIQRGLDYSKQWYCKSEEKLEQICEHVRKTRGVPAIREFDTDDELTMIILKPRFIEDTKNERAYLDNPKFAVLWSKV
jgi:hypothetical protein